MQTFGIMHLVEHKEPLCFIFIVQSAYAKRFLSQDDLLIAVRSQLHFYRTSSSNLSAIIKFHFLLSRIIASACVCRTSPLIRLHTT